jgi:hypothetical protein
MIVSVLLIFIIQIEPRWYYRHTKLVLCDTTLPKMEFNCLQLYPFNQTDKYGNSPLYGMIREEKYDELRRVFSLGKNVDDNAVLGKIAILFLNEEFIRSRGIVQCVKSEVIVEAIDKLNYRGGDYYDIVEAAAEERRKTMRASPI